MNTNDLPSNTYTEYHNIINKKALITATKIVGSAALLYTNNLSNAVAAGDSTEKVKKVKKPKVQETELGIKYIETVKGDGVYPNLGDFVVINYSAFLQNGTMFDTTEAKGRKALSFRYGKNQMIPGIESVLDTMQVGGVRTATIPPKYAYGDKGICIDGQGCLVPPGATLNYVIKLVACGASYN